MTEKSTTLISPGVGDRTNEIQRAIDNNGKSGVVVLSSGVYVCGPLRLRQGTTLCIEEPAILEFVPKYDQYEGNRVGVIAEDSDRAMIFAQNVNDVTICGRGKIRAGGDAYHLGDDGDMGTLLPMPLRPRVLVAEGCRNLVLRDVTVNDSPMWTLHLVQCENVHVSGIKVINDCRMPNTDGLVLDACQGVIVEDSVFVTADDGIVLKTSMGVEAPLGPCQNIIVRRCHVESQSCALKLGTESFSDFTEILFEHCTIAGSNRAIGLISRDGGAMAHVRFSSIRVECHETPDGFWGSGEAVTVSVLDRRPERPAGEVRNVVIEDLSGSMQGAINLVAERSGQISGIRLERIDLIQQEGTLGTADRCDQRPTPADLLETGGAEGNGRKNAWRKDASGQVLGLFPYPGGRPGLYAARVQNLNISSVKIRRPDPLPSGWSAATTRLEDCTPGL